MTKTPGPQALTHSSQSKQAHKCALLLLGGILFSSCTSNSTAPCPNGGATVATFDASRPVFVGTGDVYTPGPLAVRLIDVARCQDGAPVPLRIHAPIAPGDYPVVLLFHGTLSRNSGYDEILSHLASHGFVTIAPQMYEPDLAAVLGQTTILQEGDIAGQILAWMPGRLSPLTGVTARTDRVGLSGHSRGGRVAWLVLERDSSRAMALAGIDPTEGSANPLSAPLAIPPAFGFSIPSLVIGAELTGFCAPADRVRHARYFAAIQSPAWHVVAPDYGHVDMMDENDAAGFVGLCGGGADRAKMRQLTAGLLTAFFRGTLQGDATALDVLLDVNAAPARITAESK